MSSKVHVWERDPIKAGDVVKVVDKLTPDERLAVERLRALGNTGILEKRAFILKRVADAAQNQYEAAAAMEQYPGVIDTQQVVRPTYQLVNALMLALVLCGVIVLAVQFNRIQNPTLPKEGAPNAAPEAGEVAKAKPADQKGRAR